jgi:PAS domain S-box-containing protein
VRAGIGEGPDSGWTGLGAGSCGARFGKMNAMFRRGFGQLTRTSSVLVEVDTPARLAELEAFLRSLRWIAAAFILLFLAGGLGFRLDVFYAGAANVGLVFLAAIMAKKLARQQHIALAATTVGCAMLAHAISQAYFFPFGDLALTVSILLAVALVLPYAEGRPLLLFLGGAVLSSLIVPLVATWSPKQATLPDHVRTEIIALGVPAATFLVAMLLWQYSARTRALIEAQEEARRAAETSAAAARNSGDQVAAILKAVSEGITVHDASGRLVYANQAAARLIGFDSTEDLIRATPAEVVSKFEFRDEAGRPLPSDRLPGRVAFTEGRASEATIRAVDKRTGEVRWAVISSEPVRGPDGRVELAVNVFRDLTDRKRSEDAWRFLAEASVVLGSSLDFSTTLSSVAQLAVPQIADWCSVDLVTPAGLEQPGVAHVDPRKVELARELQRRWPHDAGAERGLGRVLRTGCPDLIPDISPDDLRSSTNDPDLRRILEALAPRSAMVVPFLVGGRPVGAISFLSAESGRRYGPTDLLLAQEIARRASLAIHNARLYTEAREALEVRNTFLSIASHELKTPLTSLMLLVTGLQHLQASDRLPQGEQLSSRLAKVEDNARHLGELIDQLLDVTRITSGRLILEPAPADLVALGRRVLERFRLQGQREGCELSFSGPERAAGRWDPGRIEGVISNLVANAIKYGSGRPVHVAVEPGDGQVSLSVIDQGPGIAPEHQRRIFEQFERAAPKNQGGLGLGLWIVRQLVEAHGGTVSLASRLGAGSTFTIHLPAEARA